MRGAQDVAPQYGVSVRLQHLSVGDVLLFMAKVNNGSVVRTEEITWISQPNSARRSATLRDTTSGAMRTIELTGLCLHRVVGGAKFVNAEAIQKNGAGLRIWTPTEGVKA